MNFLRNLANAQWSVLLVVFWSLGCSGSNPKPAVAHSHGQPKGQVVPAPSLPFARVTPNAEPEVVPELTSSALMPVPGDPDAVALRQVRLTSMTCDDYDASLRAELEGRVSEMRRALAQSFVDWKKEQPDCWQMYQEQADYWKSVTRDDLGGSASGVMKSSSSSAPRPAMAAPMRSAESVKRSAERSVKSASGTNNQVAGVDEADIVKHDGTHVYFAVNGALRIATIEPPALLSVTPIAGNVKELFVEGNRAVVYAAIGGNGRQRCTYGYDCQFTGDGSRTKVYVFDVSHRATPKLTRQLELSGSLMAARRIGNTVHTVVTDGEPSKPNYETWPSDLPRCGVLEGTVKARLKRLAEDNESRLRNAGVRTGLPTLRDGNTSEVLCQNLSRTPMSDGIAFTSLISFDMTRDQTRPTTATLQSRPGAVFMSENAMYISVTHQRPAGKRSVYAFYDQIEEVSDLHKFRVGAQPELTAYVGSGAVPGHVLNQFAMDEWYGYLRVATTRGRVPDPKVESSVSVFKEFPGGNLVRIGAVEHLAPGEDIRSVRFEAERGYVVTFKKTDPLFVLDLQRPQAPKVLGELKIPGFSTYMHRIDKNHLLSIGLDANDHGSFAYFDGVILQLFDVSQPTEPKLIHKERIGTRGSSSEAITNHLAFNFFRERGLLAIPMTICEGGGDGRNGDELSFAGLLVYQVSVTDGFKRLGGVSHGTLGSNCGTWWSNATSTVKRSLFLEDWVWSVAMDRAKVQKLGRLGFDAAELTLR